MPPVVKLPPVIVPVADTTPAVDILAAVKLPPIFAIPLVDNALPTLKLPEVNIPAALTVNLCVRLELTFTLSNTCGT